MQLKWVKCRGDVWCPFDSLNLGQVTAHGVYVIWHGGAAPNTVYVGQGNVAVRVGAHRSDTKITRHANKGDLFVTWATVPVSHRDGVERFLADTLSPLEGDQHPDVEPVPVNLPE